MNIKSVYTLSAVLVILIAVASLLASVDASASLTITCMTAACVWIGGVFGLFSIASLKKPK